MVLALALVALASASFNAVRGFANDANRAGAHLLVLAVPEFNNEYYEPYYDQILQFQANYANLIRAQQKDNVVILVDDQAEAILKQEFGIPDDVLLKFPMYDIWMRDFTTVNPYQPVQFRYTAHSFNGDQTLADEVQQRFNEFSTYLGLTFDKIDKFLDGGNIVDNYKDKIAATSRFLEDNNYDVNNENDYESARTFLQDHYSATATTTAAIFPPDDPEGLAHSDGMIMFIGDNKALLSNFTGMDGFDQSKFDAELAKFSGLQFWTSPGSYSGGGNDPTISSACGVHVNGVYTNNALYFPTFNDPKIDKLVIELLQQNADVPVYPINVPQEVCSLGGNARCLTWQITGENARKIIEKARIA